MEGAAFRDFPVHHGRLHPLESLKVIVDCLGPFGLRLGIPCLVLPFGCSRASRLHPATRSLLEMTTTTTMTMKLGTMVWRVLSVPSPGLGCRPQHPPSLYTSDQCQEYQEWS